MRLIFSPQTVSKPNYSPWFGWLAKEKGTQARGLQNPPRDAPHSQLVSRCPVWRVLYVPVSVKKEHVYMVGVISVSAVGTSEQNRHLCLWRTKTGVSGSEVFLSRCPRTSGSEMTISARWEVLGTGKCRGLADALARRFTVATSRRLPTPPHPHPRHQSAAAHPPGLSSASGRAQTCETLLAYRIRDFHRVPLYFPALTWTVLKERVWALRHKFQRRIMPL